MEESASRTDHDEKENAVSPSPDSGTSDLDANPEDQAKLPPPGSAPRSQPFPEGRFRYAQSYDPFFFKYAPDSRKLTLLKSLSQDSEYSLDTSLFDAEDFLRDMGFAGTSDPTIPDRFLPSLMQRLSEFPESEMESLHHRIVQSIGCFRRKEGKRRLFRNLSMGKGSSVDHFNRNHLPCPSNNYPLLRSNTGPAEFPFHEATTSAFEASHNSLKNGRLSSSDSGHHSMDSLKNEEEFPESPIAILVSSASVEHEERSAHEDSDTTVQVSTDDDEVSLCNDSSDAVLVPETIKNTSDGEFMSTVYEIQKLTDDIAFNEDAASYSKDSDIASTATELNEQSAPDYEKDSFTYSKCAETKPVKESPPEMMYDNSIEDKNNILLLHLDKSAPLGKNVPTKRPLRRISNTQVHNPLRHSKGFGSPEHQQKINEKEDLNMEHPGIYETTMFIESNNNDDSNDPFKNVELFLGNSKDNCGLLNESMFSFESKFSETPSSTIDSNPFSPNEKSFTSLSSNAVPSQLHSNSVYFSNVPSSRMNSIDCNPGKQIPISTKPKFTRDDSLTNFLSSMLDTSGSDSVLQPSAISPSSFNENQSKSDSEILQNNFSLENFSVQYSFNKAQSSEVISKTTGSPSFAQKVNSEVKSVSNKSPNRKRRVLRRMSSSLQCCEDVNCEDPNRFTTTENFQFSPTSPFVTPKLPMRRTKSGYHEPSPGPSHRLVNPCSSLPSMKSYSAYQTEIASCCNPFSYSTPDAVPSSSDPEASKAYHRRKERRNCKKRRCLPTLHSTPSIRESLEFNSFDGYNHEYFADSAHERYPDMHRYCICSCNESYHYKTNSNERQLGWDSYFLDKSSMYLTNCNRLNCCTCPPPHCHHSRTPGSSLIGSARHCMWNSAPDVGSEYERPELSSIRNLSVDQRVNSGAASSCCDEAHLDDVFYPEILPCCCNRINHQSDNIQSNGKRKRRVRMPQRQNSMSIDDHDDHPFSNSNNLPNSILCKSDFVSEECSSNSSSPLNGSSREVNVITSVPNILDDFQKRVQQHSDISVPIQKNESHYFESQFDNSSMNGPITNNKNEALLERKIRIFSKFFTNLGNLSKLIRDRHSDSEHKEKRTARFYDVIGADKPDESSVRDDFETTPSRKCSTPPPEFDKLIDLLNTRSRTSEGSDDRGTCHRIVREVERPVYENRVVLEAIPKVEVDQIHFKPVQFTSSVSMYINSEESQEESNVPRKDALTEMVLIKDSSSVKSEDDSRSSSQMSFKVVSKELEDLQQSIQRAKEMRMSASKELHLLQELLSGDDSAEGRNEAAKETKFPTVYPAVHLRDATFKCPEIEGNKALKDLRAKSKKEILADTSFWQDEMRKVKEDTDGVWQEKLDRMEARLASQEEELHRLQSENENLHKNLEMQRLGSPTCQCRSDNGQNGLGRIDSAFEDDEEYFSHKPSMPAPPTRQECDRLQERLAEEEQKGDQLKLLLDQKLIEFNKLQITLSRQTKEMIELEKSYLQLQCRLRKGTSKPVVARLCSRTSPFNSKNLCPKPSPPATPHSTQTRHHS